MSQPASRLVELEQQSIRALAVMRRIKQIIADVNKGLRNEQEALQKIDGLIYAFVMQTTKAVL